jgi:hypothetical protein
LLPLLCVEARPLYRALVGQFIYPAFVRRAVCPRCGTVKPPNLVGELHIHQNRKSATFVARMTREPLFPVAERDVDDAIGWLDDHWRGGLFVPDELLPLVAVAGLGKYLREATSVEAQLALSYLVWPKNAPTPRAVDEWVRRNGAWWLPERHDVPALTKWPGPEAEHYALERGRLDGRLGLVHSRERCHIRQDDGNATGSATT